MLVALVIVGLAAVRQLKAIGHSSATPVTSATQGPAVAVPAVSGSGSVGEQATQLEHRVAADALKALTQGAQAHEEASDK